MFDAPWDPTAPEDLDAALDQYGRCAALVRPSHGRRWAAYAAAGGALACAESAQAAIVYSGPQNITVGVSELNTSTDQATLAFLNGPGTATVATFRPHVLFTEGGGGNRLGRVQLDVPAAGNSLAAVAGFSFLARQLALGVNVSSGAFPNTATSYGVLRFIRQTVSGNTIANFGVWNQSDVEDEFAAIRFQVGLTTHFGWIRLRWQDNFSPGGVAAGDGIPDTLIVRDWAWEDTADTPIPTGATGTPEPGTMLLSLLAAGSVGVMAWKRRKAQPPAIPAG